MSTIKYRAWDEGNQVMHYDFQFIKSGDEGNDWIVFTSDKQTLQQKPHPLSNPYFQQQLKIMPAMDAKSLEGKLIYVGDIVETDEAGWIGEVVFERDMFVVVGTGGSSLCNWEAFKVLGNRYENPELLKHLGEDKPCQCKK